MSVDVLVVGGGPAGVGAALGAARGGVNTLLIEDCGFFGGTGAFALGMGLNQMRPGGKPRSEVHELLIKKVAAYGKRAGVLSGHALRCNVEYLKAGILDALDEVGCHYLVHARAVDAIVEEQRVRGVAIASKRGLMAIRAEVVVDASGDGDVAYFAGAETMSDPRQLMPQTLALALSNIDAAKVKPGDIADAIHQGRKQHPLIPAGFLEIAPIAQSHNFYVNHSGTADWGRLDVTDPTVCSKVECDSRRQAIQMIQAVQESGNPALQQIELAAAGPQVSVRESRQVKGLYVLTEADAMSGRTFDDAIAWRSGMLDLGGQKNGKYVAMKTHDVPYRSVLPEKIDGLLMAGRCISTTHVGAAGGKSMGNCMATGHAAGSAAALCAKKGCLPRRLDVATLQSALRADGVSLTSAKRG